MARPRDTRLHSYDVKPGVRLGLFGSEQNPSWLKSIVVRDKKYNLHVFTASVDYESTISVENCTVLPNGRRTKSDLLYDTMSEFIAQKFFYVNYNKMEGSEKKLFDAALTAIGLKDELIRIHSENLRND